MTKNSNHKGKNPEQPGKIKPESGRKARLQQALRENLKRRKSGKTD